MNFYYKGHAVTICKDPVNRRQDKEEKHDLAVYELDLFGYGKAGDNEYQRSGQRVIGNFTGMRPTHLLWLQIQKKEPGAIIMKTVPPYEK